MPTRHRHRHRAARGRSRGRLVWPALWLTAACANDNPAAPTPTTVPVDVPFSITELVVGTGTEVVVGQTVTIGLTGWIFDISTVDNKGAVFAQTASTFLVVGDPNTIAGLSQGVDGMRVGGERRVVVPPDLGFGPAGSSSVPPNATLILEIRLLSAEPIVDEPFSIADRVVGAGPAAAAGQTLTVAYTGWLFNPEAVDNQGARIDGSESFEFALGGNVIEGWNQGVEGMQVGGVRRLVVPPELGYGSAGRPPVIPPNATLIFEIELLRIAGSS